VGGRDIHVDLGAAALPGHPAVAGDRRGGVVHDPAVPGHVEAGVLEFVVDVGERAIGESDDRGVVGADERPDRLAIVGGGTAPGRAVGQGVVHGVNSCRDEAAASTTFLSVREIPPRSTATAGSSGTCSSRRCA